MRKLLIGLLLVFPLAGSAEIDILEEVDTKIICSKTDSIINELRKEYNESPLVFGEANDFAGSTMSLWVSKSGKTWTIIATKKDTSCVIGTGFNLQVVRKGKTI